MNVEPPSDEVWREVEAMVENQRSALLAWLRRRGVRSFADQCDVLQNIKVRLARWLSRKKREPSGGTALVATGLIRTAMRRLIVDRHRHCQRIPQASSDGIEGIPWAGDTQCRQTDLADNVAQALLAVPEADASLIRLAYFEGISQAELSQRFGVCPGTISRRIDRILQQLRRASEQQGGLHA